MRVLAWLAVVVTFVLVGGTLAAYAKYRSVWDSIGRVPLSDLGHRPPKYTNAVNILVFGYDERSGLTRRQQVLLHVGHVAENSSDTIMLVHLSPGRRAVTVLSLPRDLMVPAYQCAAGRLPDGTAFAGQAGGPGQVVQINAIYNAGGPSCLVKTVEQQTGIRIDHFIGLGLLGFVRAIDDIGGIEVCMPTAVNDSVSGLVLSRGWHHIDGVTALKFWRTRENLGTGSDLQRIQRDQFLMASLLHGIERSGVLGSPAKMLTMVSDLARSMITDTGLTQSALVSIAASLKGLPFGHMQFLTAPNVTDPAQPAQVIFAQPQARKVFAAIAHDRTLPKTMPRRPGTLLTAPAKVRVRVLNGSGVSGQAAKAAASLTSRGFTVVSQGNAPSYSYKGSVIEYPAAASLAAVNTLKAQLRHVTVKLNPNLARGTIELITGSSYAGLKASSKPGKTRRAVSGLSSTYGGITGKARMCSTAGKATFTGPGTVNG
jgi:LCP family protein required for cell wall assembly